MRLPAAEKLGLGQTQPMIKSFFIKSAPRLRLTYKKSHLQHIVDGFSLYITLRVTIR